MKTRNYYLQQLVALRNTDPIKVVTGVRRCGKSSMLDLFEQYLIKDGVDPKTIIRVNLESLEFDDLQTYQQLHVFLKTRLIPDAMNYLLLDEVQLIDKWEKAINSLRLLKNTDLYITGSNARLLSSELSSLLSGRFIEIKMLPLSFREFLNFNNLSNSQNLVDGFNRYLEFGGFPGITELQDNDTAVRQLVDGIYQTIIMKDVVTKNSVRDPALLDSLVRFLCGNVGSLVSTKKISDYLTSAGRKTSSETIDNYIRFLEDAYLLYKANRYDIRGKLHLKTLEKYYIVDTGIRNELVGLRGDYGHLLENIVYFELLRRGYEVSIGKLGSNEIDFVAIKAGQSTYYQVTASMLDKEVARRELTPLRAIPDNYPKVILSMDDTPPSDYEGIAGINLLDFLLNDKEI